MISIVPLEILVGICKAWKNEVFSGPSPVFCGGMFTSHGAIAPGLAGALTFILNISSLTSFKSFLANTKPTFCWICGNNFSNDGFLSNIPLMAFLILVFFPIKILPYGLMDNLMLFICLEPTLSWFTMKHLLYSVNICSSFMK